MAYVIDITHYLDPGGFLPPGPRYRIASYYGRIIAAASAHRAREPFVSAIRCNRRPGRKPCSGRLAVLRRGDDTIVWQCPGCTFEGYLYRWQGTRWDHHELLADPALGAPRFLTVSETEYEVLIGLHTLSAEAVAAVEGARMERDGIQLTVPQELLETFAEDLAAEANHCSNRRKQAVIEGIYDRVDSLLGPA